MLGYVFINSSLYSLNEISPRDTVVEPYCGYWYNINDSMYSAVIEYFDKANEKYPIFTFYYYSYIRWLSFRRESTKNDTY